MNDYFNDYFNNYFSNKIIENLDKIDYQYNLQYIYNLYINLKKYFDISLYSINIDYKIDIDNIKKLTIENYNKNKEITLLEIVNKNVILYKIDNLFNNIEVSKFSLEIDESTFMNNILEWFKKYIDNIIKKMINC